nr:MAG TPA: hypothetical protein [Microviridae sp.]
MRSKSELSSRILLSLVHKRTTHTPSQMVLFPQFLKKVFGDIKKLYTFVPCRSYSYY